ncbi:hypothetical protein GOAMI_24_00070 [Gordonia amicalis NBRC 100051 = JCM 11271]|nr:hypothetical protein GOAMI_24_00070 [Gordonia amicalis NBRC 100051 = JCM 11271]
MGHASAAAVHGLPLLKPDIEYVHVINRKKSGGSVLGHRHVHAATVDDVELVEVDGMLVTSLERTAVDVAAAGSFAQALTAFDQALRAGADRDRIAQILAGRRRQGIRNARRALSLASGLSESVGESWSRAQMIEAGLPGEASRGRTQGARCDGRALDLVGSRGGLTSRSAAPVARPFGSDTGNRDSCVANLLARLGFLAAYWI